MRSLSAKALATADAFCILGQRYDPFSMYLKKYIDVLRIFIERCPSRPKPVTEALPFEKSRAQDRHGAFPAIQSKRPDRSSGGRDSKDILWFDEGWSNSSFRAWRAGLRRALRRVVASLLLR